MLTANICSIWIIKPKKEGPFASNDPLSIPIDYRLGCLIPVMSKSERVRGTNVTVTFPHIAYRSGSIPVWVDSLGFRTLV